MNYDDYHERGYRAGYMVAASDYYGGYGMIELEHQPNESVYECGYIDAYNEFVNRHKGE